MFHPLSLIKFFENKTERIFRIHRKKSTDDGDKKDHFIYVRMDKNDYDTSVSPKTLKLHIVDSEGTLNGSDLEHRYKTVIYSQQDNKDILSTIIKGVCSPQKGAYTISGGWNNELISFADIREEKNNTSQDYTTAKETLTAKIGYPLIFFRWHGTKTFEKKLGETVMKWSYEMAGNDAIKELATVADCNEDNLCKNLFSTMQTCQLEINKTHYLATDPHAQMVSFKNCLLK